MGWLVRWKCLVACFPGTGRNSRRGRTPGISEGGPSNSPSLGTLHSLRECEGIRFESGPNGNRLTSFSSFQWPAK
jgi:hypothetical protein